MARVFLNMPQSMKLPGKPQGNLSDDEDGVQSGSATGFSDGEEMVHARPAKVVSHAFDPVNRILDKIDAELSSLTYSQGTSSTATDSTVVRRTPSHESTENSRLDSGSLTISQLGPSHKPQFSPLSSGSKHTVSTDRDTGIGTGTNSFRDSHHRSREEQVVRDLEPGDEFKNMSFGHPRRSNSPDLAILNGHHGQSDDDKSKRENMAASPFEAKQLDDKFKEIMQKRKGGFMMRASTDDDTQTIRTEDFADKFQDTLIYPSSDEAERLRNIEEDLHSDGGSDTDTMQRKLVSLTQPYLRKPKDGRPRPLPRPQRKLGPAPEIRPRKVGGPGTPPVYPKPTPTNTLPRPSTRSSIKFTPGHNSDADSVMTEDFENQFKDLLVTRDNQPADSDADTVSNDPIHTKVKELLKATAKYAGKPLSPVSNSILKSQLKPHSDKPKIEPKPKHHVRISPKPPQYQDQDKGDDSDDTLCSEKEARVTSSRSRHSSTSFYEPNPTIWREPTNIGSPNYSTWMEPSFANVSTPHTTFGRARPRNNLSSSPSIDESLSKSSLSLSQSSLSSSDKEKSDLHGNDSRNERFMYDPGIKLSPNDRDKFKRYSGGSSIRQGTGFQRQISTASSAFSSASSTFSSTSDYSEPGHASYGNNKVRSYKNTVGSNLTSVPTDQETKGSPMSNCVARRRSSYDSISYTPYDRRTQGYESTMKREKHSKKQRDLIVQDEEEEQYPFAKYTFNKKPTKSDDSSSSVSTSSRLSSSRDSVHSISLLKQQDHIQKGKMITSRPSTASLMSSVTSSLNESPGSLEDFSSSVSAGASAWRHRQFQSQNSTANLYNSNMGSNVDKKRRVSAPPPQRDFLQYDTAGAVGGNTEEFLKSYGLDEARSILPERFMKSWMDKVLTNQKKEVEHWLMMSNQENGQTLFNPESYYVDDSDFLPPSVSAQQSGANTPQWRSSLENVNVAQNTKDQRVGQRIGARKSFRRSQTLSSSNYSYEGMEQINNYNENLELEYSKAIPLSKENSFDRLKHILQSNDPLTPYKDKDWRRNRFASNRQKSLPIFLETLSEEDEERNQGRKGLLDDKQRRDYMSNMKTFLEEEENSSIRNSISSSDDTGLSDGSHNIGTYDISESLRSLRNSLSTMADDSDCSLGLDMEERKPTENKLSLPSIFVSENEVFGFDKDAVKHEEQGHTKLDPVPERPISPNPENQNNSEKVDLKSKDSLEVAEIMNSNNKQVLNINSLNKSENERGVSLVWPITAIRRTEKRNSSGSSGSKFLSINSEHDEKYLSPASSTASPLIMSPITVIEVKNLDNQNDSLELEDNKDTDSSQTNSAGPQHQHNSGKLQSHRTIGSSDNGVRRLTISEHRSETPKELSLERRPHTYEPPHDSYDTDSDDVFKAISQNSKSLETVDASLQADIHGLPPLLQLSEMSQLLQDMCSRLPSKIRENLFYMAQDQGVQCELMTEVNTDNVRAREEQLFEVEVHAINPVSEIASTTCHVKEKQNRSDNTKRDYRDLHDNEIEFHEVQCFNEEDRNSFDEFEINTTDDREDLDLDVLVESKLRSNDYVEGCVIENQLSQCRNTHAEKGVQTMWESECSPYDGYDGKCIKETRNRDNGTFITEMKVFVGSGNKKEFVSNGNAYHAFPFETNSFYVEPVNDKKTVKNNDQQYTLVPIGTLASTYHDKYTMVTSSETASRNTDKTSFESDDLMGCCNDNKDNTVCSEDVVSECTVINLEVDNVNNAEPRSVCSVLVHEHKGCNSADFDLGKEVSALINTKSIDQRVTSKIECFIKGQALSQENLSNGDVEDGYSDTDHISKEGTPYTLTGNRFSSDDQQQIKHELEQDGPISMSPDVDIHQNESHQQVAEPENKEYVPMKYAHNFHLDRISQLSSRSLDFDTLGSRKNILRRSHGTMFSKSIDVGFIPGLDDENDKEYEVVSNDTVGYGNNNFTENLPKVVSNDKLGCQKADLSGENLRGLLKDVLKLNANTKNIPKDVSEINEEQESECDVSNEGFYQVGLEYTNDNCDKDVYGRIKLLTDITNGALDVKTGDTTTACETTTTWEPSDKEHMLIQHHIENDTVVASSDKLEVKHSLKAGSEIKNHTKSGLMKEDVNIENDGLKNSSLDLSNDKNLAETSTNHAKYKSTEINGKTSIVKEELCDINSALEELDKLYRLSDDNDALFDEEAMFEQNPDTDKTNTGKYDVDNFMEELDYELEQIEIYARRFTQIQIHMCRNCGHSAEFETTIDTCVVTSKVEHDFCSRCSPLDVSVETLERRRMLKKLL